MLLQGGVYRRDIIPCPGQPNQLLQQLLGDFEKVWKGKGHARGGVITTTIVFLSRP